MTLTSYHRHSSSPQVLPWVALCPHDTCHRRGQTKLSQTGALTENNQLAHKVITAYQAKVVRAHNLPCVVVPVEEHAIRPSQGCPIPTNVVARISPDK